MAHIHKLLTILVHPDLESSDQVQKLIAQGHTVNVMPELVISYDLIFGSNCWRVYPNLTRYIDMAVKAARLIRYPKKEKTVE